MLPTSEKVQYSVGRVEHTRIQPHRQDTKQPISMYITTVLYFMIKGTTGCLLQGECFIQSETTVTVNNTPRSPHSSPEQWSPHNSPSTGRTSTKLSPLQRNPPDPPAGPPSMVHSKGAAHKSPAQCAEQQAQDLSQSPPHPFSLMSGVHTDHR